MVDPSRPTGSRSWLPGLLVALFVTLVLAVVVVPVQAAGESSGWQPPVVAPVLDPFRLPSSPWGAGNRGIAYGTADGDPVRAVDDGVVVFSGRVGGHLHVTVEHADGLRSTYAYLASTVVVHGQRVEAGQVLATATTAFHLTARIGDRYVDPGLLLEGSGGVPRLRPEPTSASARDRRPPGRPTGPGDDLLQHAGGGAGSGLTAVSELARRAGGGLRAVTATAGNVVPQVAGWAPTIPELAAVGSEVLGVTAVRSAIGTVAPLVPGAVHAGTLLSASLPNLEPVRAFGQLMGDLLPSRQALALSGAVLAWHRDGRDCTADSVAVPPGGDGRVLIQVGGLGTSSDGASIAKLDPVAAGYDPRDVVGFSYAGGCTPAPFGFDASPSGSVSESLPVHPYTASDTHQDLELSATRLADLVDAVRAARPDAPIDLAAHSLGGVVARRALEILADRHPGRSPLSVVLTIGSPHQGAELAAAATALALDPELTAELRERAPHRAIEAAATAVAQLARGTDAQIDPPREPPAGVTVVSVAAPGDLVVPADRSHWNGATNSVIGPGTDVGAEVHGDLPARTEVQRELALAVAGLPGRCISFATAVGSAVISRTVAAAEGAMAVGAIVSPWP